MGLGVGVGVEVGSGVGVGVEMPVISTFLRPSSSFVPLFFPPFDARTMIRTIAATGDEYYPEFLVFFYLCNYLGGKFLYFIPDPLKFLFQNAYLLAYLFI